MAVCEQVTGEINDSINEDYALPYHEIVIRMYSPTSSISVLKLVHLEVLDDRHPHDG